MKSHEIWPCLSHELVCKVTQKTPLTGWLVLLLLLLATAGNTVQARPSVEDFARLPKLTDLDIAPGGNALAARVNIDHSYNLVIYDISGSEFRIIYRLAENEQASTLWFHWVSADYLLVCFRFAGVRGTGRTVKTNETRLLAFSMLDHSLIPVFQNNRRDLPVQIQDRIVAWLPNEPEHILVQYSRMNPSRPSVYKVRIGRETSHKKIQKSRTGVSNWIADNQGIVRLGVGVRSGSAFMTVLPKGEKKWRNLSHRVNQVGVRFIPVQFAADPNQLYVLSNHEGDPMGLYLFNFETDKLGELIFKHPYVDISNIDFDVRALKLRSVNFIDDAADTHHYSRRPIEEKVESLSDFFPGSDLWTISVSNDDRHAVVKVTPEKGPGFYVVYNGDTRRGKRLPNQYPGLSEDVLGQTISTSYSARDGLEIPAFVSLPPGYETLDSVNKIPFVIMPHGGPASRDFLRFDYWVQFLVSRGYGVLQMNFRGSEGYGQAFEEAGEREWGQAMQDDITDGVHWLLEQDVADAERVAIVGGSYGGYAALMGAVKTPDLYQCAVSFAGVSDLPDLIKHELKFVGGQSSTKFIGTLWKDRKMLATNSPARRAEDIRIPILLFHGDKDTVVDIWQSKKMSKALKKHKVEHQFIEFENGDHHLSLYTHRLRFLSETEQFLADCFTR